MNGVRVLYLSYDGILEPIGTSQVVTYLERLAERGCSVHLISFEKAACLQDRAQVRAMRTRLAQRGVGWTSLRYHRRCRVVATAWDMLRGWGTGLVVCARRQMQVIHARSFVAAMTGWLIRCCYPAKFIYDVRGFWSDELQINGRLRPGLLCRAIRTCEQLLLRRADHVIVLTEAAKAYLQTLGMTDLTRVSAIPCGVDDRFQFTAAGRARMRAAWGLMDTFIVLYVGSMENWYRIDAMLDCFAAIRRVIPQAHFVILTSDARRVLPGLMARAGVPAEAVTVTAVPHAQMPEAMSAADLGLFFIKRAPAAAGISPVKLAEYLGCGVPVLSNTGIGDMDRLFATYAIGTLIADHTPAAYEQAVREILALRRTPERLHSACARAVTQELSVHIGVSRYAAVYERVTSGEAQPSPTRNALATAAPIVSVVIPTYNRAVFLREAIDSVLRQTFPAWELIVVDDGSTDGTRELVLGYDHPRIRYLAHEQQRERAAARNTGIRHARGRYIALLDSDDRWLPGHLEHCVSLLERSPDVGLVYAGSYLVDARGTRIGRRRLREGRNNTLETLVSTFCAGGCNASSAVLRRTLVDTVGWFNEDRALSGSEDWELWARAAAATSFRSTGCYTVELRHHEQMSSVQTDRMRDSMTRALDTLYRNVALLPRIARLRTRAYAALHTTIATNYYGAGEMREARAALRRAVATDPACLFTNPQVGGTFVRSLLGVRVSAALRRLKWLVHAKCASSS